MDSFIFDTFTVCSPAVVGVYKKMERLPLAVFFTGTSPPSAEKIEFQRRALKKLMVDIPDTTRTRRSSAAPGEYSLLST